MHFLLLLFSIFMLPTLVYSQVNFRNDREGKSLYSSKDDLNSIRSALNEVEKGNITTAYEETLKSIEEDKVCSFDVTSSFENKLKLINPRFNQTKGAILWLRQDNQIDDSVTKILLLASKTQSEKIRYPKNRQDLKFPDILEVIEPLIKLIGDFDKTLTKQGCLDVAFKTLYGDLLRTEKSLTYKNLEALFFLAFDEKHISYETFLMLEKARLAQLQTATMSLKDYLKKIKSLRLQYPLANNLEKSDFISKKLDDSKISLRQRLLESYTDIQIIQMGNIIKKLHSRLEASKIELVVYSNDNQVTTETIPLEPMERYRFAVQILRKEMAHLSLNTYFKGRSPDYFDLIAASYEIGLVPASEIEQLSKLKEIWVPKKKFWDKASVWIRTISSVATIAAPPPFGFIPVLALVVIEMTVGKKEKKETSDLF